MIRLVPTADGYLAAVLTGRYEGCLRNRDTSFHFSD
jgi:hypothetical protein